MPPIRKARPPLRPTFLRQWRKHRGFTLEAAADFLDMDRTTLGRIEKAEVPYQQHMLEPAAELYRCSIHELLYIDPSTEEDYVELSDIVRGADREQIAEVIGYARGVMRRKP